MMIDVEGAEAVLLCAASSHETGEGEPVKQGMIAASIAGLGIALWPLPASAESGTLHVEKECSQFTGAAGSFCTITSSNFDAIPTGSKVVYKDAVKTDGGLDTDIVINTPEGDTATGHVVLDGKTETGTVTLTGGTGKLAKLAGDLKVTPIAAPNYSWDGPYSY